MKQGFEAGRERFKLGGNKQLIDVMASGVSHSLFGTKNVNPAPRRPKLIATHATFYLPSIMKKLRKPS